ERVRQSRTFIEPIGKRVWVAIGAVSQIVPNLVCVFHRIPEIGAVAQGVEFLDASVAAFQHDVLRALGQGLIDGKAVRWIGHEQLPPTGKPPGRGVWKGRALATEALARVAPADTGDTIVQYLRVRARRIFDRSDLAPHVSRRAPRAGTSM